MVVSSGPESSRRAGEPCSPQNEQYVCAIEPSRHLPKGIAPLLERRRDMTVSAINVIVAEAGAAKPAPAVTMARPTASRIWTGTAPAAAKKA
jgi:hypothetical protein